MLLQIAIGLIALHLVDGREVLINPRQVTRLGESRPEGDPQKTLTDEVRCVIWLTDGTYVAVIETCGTVRKLMEEKG